MSTEETCIYYGSDSDLMDLQINLDISRDFGDSVVAVVCIIYTCRVTISVACRYFSECVLDRTDTDCIIHAHIITDA